MVAALAGGGAGAPFVALAPSSSPRLRPARTFAMGDASVHMHSRAVPPRVLPALVRALAPARLSADARGAVEEALASVADLDLLGEAPAADADSREARRARAEESAAIDAYEAHVLALAEGGGDSALGVDARVAGARLLGQLARSCSPHRASDESDETQHEARLAAAAGSERLAAHAARSLADLLERAASAMDVPGVRKAAAEAARRGVAAACVALDGDTPPRRRSSSSQQH